MKTASPRTKTAAKAKKSTPSDPVIGVWIDMGEANIISLDSARSTVQKVSNDLEKHKHILTARHAGTQSGRQFISKERSEQEKLDHELDHYLAEVLKVLGVAPRMVVFGPAATKKELAKRMKANARWRRSELTVVPADKMTEKQKVAWLREYAEGE
jgi:hypothetical protein